MTRTIRITNPPVSIELSTPTVALAKELDQTVELHGRVEAIVSALAAKIDPALADRLDVAIALDVAEAPKCTKKTRALLSDLTKAASARLDAEEADQAKKAEAERVERNRRLYGATAKELADELFNMPLGDKATLESQIETMLFDLEEGDPNLDPVIDMNMIKGVQQCLREMSPSTERQQARLAMLIEKINEFYLT